VINGPKTSTASSSPVNVLAFITAVSPGYEEIVMGFEEEPTT
jgi:hypothetical protein